MSCKVRIDAPHGIVEIEGDAEFVASFYEKLAPLVDRAHFGTAVRIEEAPPALNDNGNIENQMEIVNEAKDKKKRKTPQRPPTGSSCRDRILRLKVEEFFKTKKTASEIVTGLATNGFTHSLPQVGAALTPMFEKGELQRTKDGGGSWQYFWDRG